MLLLQQMMVLFIIMLLGYFCFKKGYLSKEASKAISFIVVNIANPALILSGSINNSGEISGNDLLITIILAGVVYFLLIIFAFIVPIILRVPQEKIGVYRVMLIFSNIGFMGFPVIQAMYGSDALLFGSIFLFPYNILIYTYGISVLKKNKEDKEQAWKKILNIGTIFCLISIVIYFLKPSIPVFIRTTTTNLSNLTAPLSMLVIGGSLAQMELKKLFINKRLLLFSIIKLIIIPLIGILILKQFIDNPILIGVCFVMLATPVGSMTAMLATQYEGDSELASSGVALTTILSVVTMPFVFSLL